MKYLFKKFRVVDYLLMFLILVFIITQTFFEMEFIGFTEKILGLSNSSAVAKDYWGVGLQMLGVAGIILACIIIVNIISAYFSSRIAKNLRRDIFEKVNSFSNSEINKFSTPSLITRSTNDVTQVQRTFMMTLKMSLTAPCMAFFAIRKITTSCIELTWVTVGFVALTLVVIISLLFFVMPKFSILQKRIDRLNLVTRENLTGIRVVRAYNGEKYQESKFSDANEKLTKTELFLNRTMSILNPFISLVMSCMTLSMYWIGSGLFNKHIVGYEQIATFGQYTMHVIMSFMFITLMFVMIPRGLVSLRRITEILNTEVSIKDGNVSDSEKLGTIEFRNVSFKYPDAEECVLDNISFTVNKGETVAFIGSTGSGKSTLINLIPRFYDVTSGQVLVDGLDVKCYTLEALHDKIGYVPQKANLFTGNITTNLQLANENITDEEIEKCLSIAECSFIEKLDDGYTQPVSAGGKNFSGGQKQRLSIARAIAKKPEIFIFDDSFSALDFKTDKTLRSNLKKQASGVTTLIVAQRINTIKDADKIIVLDDGKMVGMGKHQDLIKNNKVYIEIAESQNYGE